MAIPGLQSINVGLPNESANSDSLYAAFNKVNNNFSNLFNLSSQYTSFTSGNGINVSANANTGVVFIQNTGVTELIAGSGIVLSGNTGQVTISSTGGGNGNGSGTVTSVSVIPASSQRITSVGSPITTSGNIVLDLATTSVAPGTYVYPTLQVDQWGRIISAANGNSVGTVTSVGLTAGAGITITGGPITSNGNMIVTNTGVTRLNAGTGISLSSSNGNITVSAAGIGTGTVTSIGVTSTSLIVSGGPITSFGNISVDLPSTLSVSGSITGGNLVTAGTVRLNGSENLADGAAANLLVTASYFTTTGASTATLGAGTNGQIKTFMMVADGGDMVITVTNAGWKTSGTGTITFGDIGDGCTLQYINSKWYCIGQNGVSFA